MPSTDTLQGSITWQDSDGSIKIRENEGRTSFKFGGDLNGATGEFSEGKTTIKADTIRGSSFSFSDPGSQTMAVMRAKVKNSNFVGNDSSQSIRFTKSVMDSKIDMKAGRDSVTFTDNIKDTIVDLGDDNNQDGIEIGNLSDANGLRIKNFGRKDQFKIGNRSYDYQSLQNEDFGGKIIIEFKD